MSFCLASLVILIACQESPTRGENQKGSQLSNQASSETITVSAAKPDVSGVLVHEVTSPYQAGKTSIRVLLPDARKVGAKFSVIYVLPVEAGTESRYGDGLAEIKKLGLPNKHRVIFVAPTFSHLPWYADHP